MTNRNPGPALGTISRIKMMPDLMQHAAVKEAVANSVPVTMPPEPGAMGFVIPMWVGLGTVGIWAAMEAFSDRAALPKTKCPTCSRRSCILGRFNGFIQNKEGDTLAELDDFRHLYAHNFAGYADVEYFNRPRHVLALGNPTKLTCGTDFNGQQLLLGLPDLQFYSDIAIAVISRVS